MIETTQLNYVGNRDCYIQEARTMLTAEDNELVTRVGPNTPLGDTMRRYWMPTLLS